MSNDFRDNKQTSKSPDEFKTAEKLNASHEVTKSLISNDGKSAPVSVANSTKQESDDKMNAAEKEPPMTLKKLLEKVIKSVVFRYFIVFLILLYMGLVFANFALDDSSFKDDEDAKLVSKRLLILELIILFIFTIEILMKSYTFTFKKYFRDRWLFFDAIVIIASIVLVFLDLYIESSSFRGISQIIRGIFRLLRIFLLFRKVSQFKKISKKYSKFDIKTPLERVMEILINSSENIEDRNMMGELEWCMTIISSNKLYDPILDNNANKEFDHAAEKGGPNEVLSWIENYSGRKRQSHIPLKTRRRQSELHPRKVVTVTVKTEFSIPQEVQDRFSKILELEFDCFELDEISEGKGLIYLMMHTFETLELFEKLNINSKFMLEFVKTVQDGYLKNPYHNKIHAFDVTQTVNFFLRKCKFMELATLTDLELAAMYISASIHDLGHPGLTNVYLINTRHDYALRYNDKSVLENFHVATAFEIMQNDSSNVFCYLSREDYKVVRERMISMVLATDMSQHFSDLAKLKGRLVNADFDIKGKDKFICMDHLIHAADISNPLKPIGVYSRWTERVLEEFFNQGDLERERGLPISYLCDRYTVNVSKSQIGFIDVIVQPMYQVLSEFLQDLVPYLKNFENNKNYYKSKMEEYDQKLSKISFVTPV